MAIKFTNNASGTLAASITAAATSITLTTGQGALFPALSAGDYFYATLADSSNNLEIIKVTARTGDSLTATRGQEGTSARAYSAGDKLELRATAAALADVASGVNLTSITTLTTALPVNQGGTGSTTASGARTNLGTVADTTGNGIAVRTAANTLTARTVTAGTGISVTNGDGVAGNPTITNAGVTGLTAGTGISVSASTGASTITNTGVTSFNGATGAVTFDASDYSMVAYTTAGTFTWTKPAGLKAVYVRVVGGGGAGGVRRNTTTGKASFWAGGHGGGAGGSAEKYIDAATLGSTETVTIVATGGSASFGAHCSATGGTAATASVPGNGGTGSSGDINGRGGSGFRAVDYPNTTQTEAGAGGSSIFSGGVGGTVGTLGAGSGGNLGTNTGATGTAAGTGAVVVEQYF